LEIRTVRHVDLGCGQIVAELACVDDIVGERDIVAPGVQIRRAGIVNVGSYGWPNTIACHWAW
jgi:hypothetical protein